MLSSRRVLSFCLLVLSLAVGAVGYGYVAGSLGGAADQTVGQPEAAVSAQDSVSYVIFQDVNGITHAKSGQDGAVHFSGNDAGAVITQAIQSLPVDRGGEIRIRAGHYDLKSPIRIDRHGIHLSGEGRKSGCYGGPPYVKSSRPINLVEIRLDGQRLRGVTISNISFFGSGVDNGKCGIVEIGCSDFLTIQNVGVYGCETGIHLCGGPAGHVDAPQIINCDPQQCGRGMVLECCCYVKVLGGAYSDNGSKSLPAEKQCGIYLTSNAAGPTMNVSMIGVGAVRNAGAGILVGKGCVDTTISGGTDVCGNKYGGVVISDEGTGQRPNNAIISSTHIYNNRLAGIVLDKADHVLISGCINSVHKAFVVPDMGQQYAVHVKEGCRGIAIHGNMFYGNAKDAVRDDTAAAQTVQNFNF